MRTAQVSPWALSQASLKASKPLFDEDSGVDILFGFPYLLWGGYQAEFSSRRASVFFSARLAWAFSLKSGYFQRSERDKRGLGFRD